MAAAGIGVSGDIGNARPTVPRIDRRRYVCVGLPQDGVDKVADPTSGGPERLPGPRAVIPGPFGQG